MRKPFVEPTIKRIELNLRENIASSGGMMTIPFRLKSQDQYSCTVEETGVLWAVIEQNFSRYLQLAFTTCYAGGNSSNIAVFSVPSDLM